MKLTPTLATCFDCHAPYPFGLDIILSNDQWLAIFPERGGEGLLCGSCIAKRAMTLKGKTVIKAEII